MERATKTGADVLVEGLIKAGVEVVFGLPGDTGVDLYDSLRRAAPSIRHVMCRDERHAASMADVYARCRNTLGVVEVSSGGGATYCVGGLGEPFAASVPLLVVSSDIHAGSRDTGALTELDQQKLFSGVTKWVKRVDRACDIPRLLVEAISAATSDRPAPVAIIVPEDVLASTTSAAGVRIDASIPGTRSRASIDAIRALGSALSNAERPAIVVGGGVHLSNAYEELRQVVDAGAVPVATTIHGKGAYPESHPWSLGVIGANGGRPYANSYLENADFVLFVGTRANATDTNSYRSPPRSTTVAQIDIDPARAGRNYPNSLPIVADAKSALADLAAELNGTPNERTQLKDDLEDLRQSWRAVEAPVSPAGTIHPLQVFQTVRATFGSDAVVVADCGTATPFLAAHWETTTAGRRLIMARGHGPMGYAIPGAVGAALANPNIRIVGITTDGSVGMACGEFETAVRLQLPISFVQLTNGTYGWIKMLQHLYHDRNYFGVDLGAVDAPAIAQAFGMPGSRVNTQWGLKAALEETIDQPGPTFVEVSVPDLLSLRPPVASWVAALDGVETTRPVY